MPAQVTAVDETGGFVGRERNTRILAFASGCPARYS